MKKLTSLFLLGAISSSIPHVYAQEVLYYPTISGMAAPQNPAAPSTTKGSDKPLANEDLNKWY